MGWKSYYCPTSVILFDFFKFPPQSDELRNQLESEQHFCHKYRAQAGDLRAQLDDSVRAARDLEDERSSLIHQLQLAIARADSEALAK